MVGEGDVRGKLRANPRCGRPCTTTHRKLEGRARDVGVHVLDADGVDAQFLGDEVDTKQTIFDLQRLRGLADTFR